MSLPSATNHVAAASQAAPLDAVVRAVLATARHGLQQALEAADEALFDLSCRAGNDQGQHRYFDAMRLLRLARDDLQRRFAEAVLERWREQAEMRSGGHRQLMPEPEMMLGLVSEEDLEQRLAVDAIVARFEVSSGTGLSRLQAALSARFGRGLDACDCAIGPRGLCETLRQVCASLDVSLPVRILLLQCFELHVLARLPETYARIAAPASSPRGADTPRPASTDQRVSRGSERHALSGSSTADVAATRQSSTRPAAPRSPQAKAQAQAQARGGQPLVSADEVEQESDSPWTCASSGADAGDDQATQHAIAVADAVQRLFEQVGLARDLPADFEAAVRRLQVPLVRAALADASLLEDPEHPARQFLEELAGWSRRWGRHPGAEKMVLKRLARIHALPEEDGLARLAYFRDETSFLRRTAADLVRRAQIAERRAREARQGRDRLRAAESAAAAALSDRPQLSRLPAAFARFVKERWARYLVLVHLRHGLDSVEWARALGFLDDLVAAVGGERVSFDTQVLESGVLATGGVAEDLPSFRDALRGLAVAAAQPPPRPAGAPPETVASRTPGAETLLAVGQWLEWRAHRSPPQRVKLAWMGARRDRYVFVDARGLPSLDCDRTRLADMMSRGELRASADPPAGRA